MKFATKGGLKALLAGAALALSSVTAFAQSVEDFYKGKTVELLVGAAAGTPSDFMARQVATYLTKHIPGNPDVVVMNVAGAGGMLAAGQLQSKSPKDGTVIGFLQRNNLLRPLIEDKHSSFDPREVEWLGSLNKEFLALVATQASGITKFEQVMDEEMVLGATGVANENRIIPQILADSAGAKFKIIHGYTGREEVYLAMERGEVDGWLATVNGLTYGEPAAQLSDGRLHNLMIMSWGPHPRFPEVPTLADIEVNDETKALIDFFVLPSEAGRPLAVPAGVPEDRVAALRAAFDAATKDEEFIAHMVNLQNNLEPVGADVIESILEALYAAPPEVVKQAAALMTAN